MPAYPWLYSDDLKTNLTQRKLEAMRKLGVPYTDTEITSALSDLQREADGVAAKLFEQGVAKDPELSRKEIVAIIAYLQRVGTDIKGLAK